MKIRDLFREGRPLFSFEFFPPKTPVGEAALFKTIERLKPLKPAFVSITYGAGGSTRAKTIEWARRIKFELGLETAVHLTCVGASRREIKVLLDQVEAAGIENVLALRGDPPRGETEFKPAPDGFRYASELVRFIRAEGYPFSLGGAGYPEGHVECRDREQDLLHLKHKVDSGLDFVITQLFFDNHHYFDFLERAERVGIRVPIVPGIMPITNIQQVQRFTKMCGASIPRSLLAELERFGDDDQAVLAIGVEHATRQCQELLDAGVPGIHFYTLNKSPATRLVVRNLRVPVRKTA
ncbi:methylenetetrahydrofolate reductase [NAD(P)H] [Marinithermus hydrothermalis]|uniref:Methylenetetrahydrofolate reductase n=1 Tax=Marinithermus hydrothermalis (strain DSM 14884 / JCM 11576 / T1) TaxID=869210 RepID=F2NP99_MARHT|nr:methylenetetrahydrofolate reductase [NAD(P)H] [Marinithermus hydrothermalis]AEB11900.1 5,10-methylenetetrahydrofolate reductase [Marinithermus hydrothermalis DSM 14884]